MMELKSLKTHQLLVLFSGVLDELRRRETIRSTNNPVADYAESLVSRALSLTLAPKSSTGYDAIDALGQRYEIKGRRPTRQNSSRQLSAIRGLEAKHFSFLAGVLFNGDFSVHRACLIPYEAVKQLAIYRPHVNAWILHLRDSVWSVPGVQDITDPILQVQLADRA
ncbi:MAG TPA: hypothetical protein VEY11_16560 [Pyrinomonadaceae bacterium]|nr:hypothetical protein [Pyrinomonadaceae bacterium]